MIALNQTSMTVMRALAGVVADPLLRAYCVTVLCNRVLLASKRLLEIWEHALAISPKVLKVFERP
jgi:hypothetical protein